MKTKINVGNATRATARLAGALTLSIGVVCTASAAMLGSVGPTYPIAEQSAVDQILAQLKAKQKTGELARLQKEAIQRSMNSAKNPAPVQGIVTATARSEQLIDPTVTYTQAVRMDDGRVVIPAGTKVNPLDVMPFTETLVFFDGRDPEQAEAIGRLLSHPNNRIKPILVAGSWLDLTKRFKTQVYFDQKGTLTQRFGVTTVPALVSQRGKSLALTVIPAKELK